MFDLWCAKVYIHFPWLILAREAELSAGNAFAHMSGSNKQSYHRRNVQKLLQIGRGRLYVDVCLYWMRQLFFLCLSFRYDSRAELFLRDFGWQLCDDWRFQIFWWTLRDGHYHATIVDGNKAHLLVILRRVFFGCGCWLWMNDCACTPLG